jgi:hypothetical protein
MLELAGGFFFGGGGTRLFSMHMFGFDSLGIQVCSKDWETLGLRTLESDMYRFHFSYWITLVYLFNLKLHLLNGHDYIIDFTIKNICFFTSVVLYIR